MSERIHTFGKLFLEADKMAGLRLAIRNPNTAIANPFKMSTVLGVQGWDDHHIPTIDGMLVTEQNDTIWEGTLVTADQIRGIFQPFADYDNKMPRTYARRSGRLGRPKTQGRISTIATVSGLEIKQLKLFIHVNQRLLQSTIFDRDMYIKN